VRIEADMDKENRFTVGRWWAVSPEFVIQSLEQQLEAASAIWPELAAYKLIWHAPRVRGGKLGGHARAAALTPERRSEIATNAANTRWNNQSSEDNQP
jgi:hypothetical protein